jgi:hypothetical protein
MQAAWWQECLRSAPITKCVLTAALLILLALAAPVHADDPIAEWLKQDESDGQNDQVRPDLHALTDQQLQDIFKIGRDQADSHQLTERGSERHPRVLYIWFVTIAAGFGAVIGAVKTVLFVRRQLSMLLGRKIRKYAARLWRIFAQSWFTKRLFGRHPTCGCPLFLVKRQAVRPASPILQATKRADLPSTAHFDTRELP